MLRLKILNSGTGNRVNTSSLGFLRFRQGESKACALIYMQVQGHHPYRLATFQAHIADLTSNLDTY